MLDVGGGGCHVGKGGIGGIKKEGTVVETKKLGGGWHGTVRFGRSPKNRTGKRKKDVAK